MQIEIDFEVFKSLTALRNSEADSYNLVLRRVLGLGGELPDSAAIRSQNSIAELLAKAMPVTADKEPYDAVVAALLAGGVWYNGVLFPEETQFRATYKGRTYFASVRDGRWVGQDGVVRTSPSDAASAISGTNVNGWRFWRAIRPGETEWKLLDDFR